MSSINELRGLAALPQKYAWEYVKRHPWAFLGGYVAAKGANAANIRVLGAFQDEFVTITVAAGLANPRLAAYGIRQSANLGIIVAKLGWQVFVSLGEQPVIQIGPPGSTPVPRGPGLRIRPSLRKGHINIEFLASAGRWISTTTGRFVAIGEALIAEMGAYVRTVVPPPGPGDAVFLRPLQPGNVRPGANRFPLRPQAPAPFLGEIDIRLPGTRPPEPIGPPFAGGGGTAVIRESVMAGRPPSRPAIPLSPAGRTLLERMLGFGYDVFMDLNLETRRRILAGIRASAANGTQLAASALRVGVAKLGPIVASAAVRVGSQALRVLLGGGIDALLVGVEIRDALNATAVETERRRAVAEGDWQAEYRALIELRALRPIEAGIAGGLEPGLRAPTIDYDADDRRIANLADFAQGQLTQLELAVNDAAEVERFLDTWIQEVFGASGDIDFVPTNPANRMSRADADAFSTMAVELFDSLDEVITMISVPSDFQPAIQKLGPGAWQVTLNQLVLAEFATQGKAKTWVKKVKAMNEYLAKNTTGVHLSSFGAAYTSWIQSGADPLNFFNPTLPIWS